MGVKTDRTAAQKSLKWISPSLSQREKNKLVKQIRLFDAAMQLFAEQSYEAVSVDDICELAGYSRATYYRLFGNKAGLIEELHRRLAVSIENAVRDHMATGLRALRLAAEVMRDSWIENVTLVHDLVAEYIRNLDQVYATVEGPRIDAARHGGFVLVEQASRFIREGQANGEIRANLDPRFMGVIVISQFGTALSLWSGQAQHDAEGLRDKLEQVIQCTLRGLAV